MKLEKKFMTREKFKACYSTAQKSVTAFHLVLRQDLFLLIFFSFPSRHILFLSRITQPFSMEYNTHKKSDTLYV